jgi:hypothetical protein
MNLEELIDTTRQEIREVTSPSLFTDELLTRYANDAVNEACRRARLLIDSTTVEICLLTFDANDPMAELDQRIIFVRRAKIVGQTRPLSRTVHRELDSERSGWEDETNSIPSHFVTDWQTGYLRLYPTPTATLDVALTVVRLPLAAMVKDADTPEINARYHDSLIHWMKYRCYLTKDADIYDKDEALKCLGLFELEFGKRSSAVDEEWIAREQQLADDGTY